MIYYIDDFLPQDQFDALADRVKKGFRGDKSLLVAANKFLKKITECFR